MALILGFAKFNWSIIGDLSLAVISLLDALVLYLMGATHSIWMGYAGYIVFRALYQTVYFWRGMSFVQTSGPSTR